MDIAEADRIVDALLRHSHLVERGAPSCIHCRFGHAPVRLRRRWVHHFPETGQLVVCEEKNIKRES